MFAVLFRRHTVPKDTRKAAKNRSTRASVRDDALRELTLSPEEILASSTACGSIENGKIANLVVAGRRPSSRKNEDQLFVSTATNLRSASQRSPKDPPERRTSRKMEAFLHPHPMVPRNLPLTPRDKDAHISGTSTSKRGTASVLIRGY